MLTRPPRPSGFPVLDLCVGDQDLALRDGQPQLPRDSPALQRAGAAGRGPCDIPLHLGVDADALDDAAPLLELGLLGPGGPVDRHVVADLGPFDQTRPGGLFGEPIFGGELLAAAGSLAG